MEDFQAARVWVLKPTPTVTHLLQQIHSNSATPWAKHIQTMTLGEIVAHAFNPKHSEGRGRRVPGFKAGMVYRASSRTVRTT